MRVIQRQDWHFWGMRRPHPGRYLVLRDPRPQETEMGYGNPLFDGDEPLPAQDPKQRIVSLRLWRGRLLAGSRSEGAALPNGNQDEDGSGRGPESQGRQGQGERNQRS